MNVVHVTHEAVENVGGIGTVISGLTTAEAYNENVNRTILLGPLFSTDKPARERLGQGGKIIYSSLDEMRPREWAEKFTPIERTYDVHIIYGTRRIHEPYSDRTVDVEVIIVDVFHANEARLNLFKGQLFEKFQVPSEEFQKIWEYEEYVRLAEPGFEALKAIGAIGTEEQMVLLAHEYMGMPTALKATLDGSENVRTVFYAHEVASVRPIVEKQPGHDTMFYNAMEKASKEGKTLEDIFPQTRDEYKHPLVKACRYCDHIFAVGDYVVSELKFLDRHVARTDIDLVYNGIPAENCTAEQRRQSRHWLKNYASSLLGWEPTWIFTHVARPVLSKGIWRDLRVMHELESRLAERDESAVFFMLGTLAGERRRQDVLQMERVYGWPLAHETGYPDLAAGEEVVGGMFDAFNRDHKASRAVFVNQWGFDARRCGRRMPEEMSIADLRRGSDLEFGLSVYEPFGISQLEPLSFGALCVVSNVCGCTGFVNAVREDEAFDNVIEANFLGLEGPKSLEDVLACGSGERDAVEDREAKRLADVIIERLPRDAETIQRRIESGTELASRMSWERVVTEYFLPSLDRVAEE
jgi:glycosyltransferase involved in cell wall biosynthesis